MGLRCHTEQCLAKIFAAMSSNTHMCVYLRMYFCFVYVFKARRRNKLSSEIKIALGANASAQRLGKMLHLDFGKETNGTRDPQPQNYIQKHLYNLHACGDMVQHVAQCSAKQRYLYISAFKNIYLSTRGVIQFVWFSTKRLSLRRAHILTQYARPIYIKLTPD